MTIRFANFEIRSALRRAALAVCLALPPGSQAPAAPFNYTWRIEELARADTDVIELRGAGARLLKKVDVQQMVYLYSVMQAISKVSEMRSELLITDGEQPNAFATRGTMALTPAEDGVGDGPAGSAPGRPVTGSRPAEGTRYVDVNIIGINFAMLDILGLDVHMAAALIGHELGHLKLNHGEEHRTRSPADLRTAGNTRYSRDNEREADYLGAVWAVEAGYDPTGAVRLQEIIYKKTKHLSGGFSGTHPSSIERITKLKSLARRLSR